jgi:hypothetical protein
MPKKVAWKEVLNQVNCAKVNPLYSEQVVNRIPLCLDRWTDTPL